MVDIGRSFTKCTPFWDWTHIPDHLTLLKWDVVLALR